MNILNRMNVFLYGLQVGAPAPISFIVLGPGITREAVLYGQKYIMELDTSGYQGSSPYLALRVPLQARCTIVLLRTHAVMNGFRVRENQWQGSIGLHKWLVNVIKLSNYILPENFYKQKFYVHNKNIKKVLFLK